MRAKIVEWLGLQISHLIPESWITTQLGIRISLIIPDTWQETLAVIVCGALAVITLKYFWNRRFK
jgi:hypothetical protein